jgi:hypothetical protein
MLVELEVGGLRGSIEFKQLSLQFPSYIARITWGETYSKDGYLANWQSVAKSFGDGTKAENWLLDQLENPSFFILQNQI